MSSILHVAFWQSGNNTHLGSVHTALAIALALAMPKSGSLAIAVLAKEWVGMPFLSKILSENLSFSSVFLVSHSYR